MATSGSSDGRPRSRAGARGHLGGTILLAVLFAGACASPVPTAAPRGTAPATSAPLTSVQPAGSPTQDSTTPGSTPPGLSSSAPLPSPSTPATASTPAPTAPGIETAWQPVGTQAPHDAVATLAPLAVSGGLIAPTSAFELVSVHAEPAAAIAARLVVEPATPLSIEPGADAAHVILRPQTPFAGGSVVHFRLADGSGALAESWAYQVDRAPRVVGMLPGDGATTVPVNTGIEATFDQDGIVVGAADIAISPPVAGRVEMNGRTVAFVPAALQAGTLYTVTIRKGVGRKDSPFSLAADVSWRFETARAASAPAVSAQLVGQLFDARPSDPALLIVSASGSDSNAAIPGAVVVVARLPGRAAAIADVRTLADRPSWADAGRQALIPAAGLPVVMRATLPLIPIKDSWVLGARLPDGLPAGWYLLTLTLNGYVSQAVLQVTDLAPFVTITDTRTLAWINDAASAGPVAGARITLEPGGALGATDGSGILDAATPASVVKAVTSAQGGGQSPDLTGTSVLIDTPDGRHAFVIPGGRVLAGLAVDLTGTAAGAGDAWWLALTTDRLQYRTTDTLNAWGYLRGRAHLDVPAGADLVLVPDSVGADGAGPAVASATVTPDASGAYATSLPLRDLPAGFYTLSLLVGGVAVDSVAVSVGTIRKPLYRLGLTLDRFAVLAGDEFGASVDATFYDGSPAAGIDVRADAGGSDGSTALTTGTDGRTTTRLTALGNVEQDGPSPDYLAVGVNAAAPEEASISASAGILMFSSPLLIDADSSLKGRTLVVSGAVHQADIARLNALPSFEAAQAADPRGAPAAGQTLTIDVVENWSVRSRTGTSYDPITKLTTPTYDWTARTHDLPAGHVTTGADGRYRVTLTVPDAAHWYSVRVSTRAANRSQSVANTSAEAVRQAVVTAPPVLAFAPPSERACPTGCRIDETYGIRLTGAHALPTGGANRYLYLVDQRGLRRWSLSAEPRRTETFRASDAPNVQIDAVWFTGAGYALADNSIQATLAPGARTLKVSVTSDQPRYAPGGTATVRVAVTDPAGGPAAGASLVVAVVDQKLFDVSGGAPISDPVQMLYATAPSGILSTSAFPALTLVASGGGGCAGVALSGSSHGVIAASTCGGGTGGGSTTGGPGGNPDTRVDFADVLLFRSVTTDSGGLATISIPLSDDITSWRVAVAAMDGQVQGGVGTASLPVGLPFFADVTVAPEYLATDRPSVVVRAFGSAIRPDATVTWTVSSDTLPMAPVTITGPASGGATVALPALTVGTHRLTVAADDGSHHDALVRTFSVVATRRLSPVVQAWDLAGVLHPEGNASGLSTYVVSDAGRGHWVERLLELAADPGIRADQQAASVAARALLVSTFHLGDTALPPPTASVGAFRAPTGGFTIVAYGSVDLEMTVRVLLAAPDLGTPAESAWLHAILADDNETVERKAVALAGLAAMGEPVLAELQARAGAGGVPLRQQLWLGLGLAALGDDAGAAAITRAVAAAIGQQRGIEVRLAVSSSDDAVAQATAQFAELAAAVGDPLAGPALAYVADHPSRTDLDVAEEVATIRALLAREPATTASVAWTVDGVRTVTDLSTGNALSLVLTPAQRASLTLEPVSGQVSVVGRWMRDGAPDAAPSADLSLARVVTPAGGIGRSDLVRVLLRPTFASGSPAGEYRIDELVPSGLAPLDSTNGWVADAGMEVTLSCTTPDEVDGQSVRFSTATTDAHRLPLCYVARVVTPGTYTWEPATLWSEEAPEVWAATPPVDASIP